MLTNPFYHGTIRWGGHLYRGQLAADEALLPLSRTRDLWVLRMWGYRVAHQEAVRLLSLHARTGRMRAELPSAGTDR